LTNTNTTLQAALDYLERGWRPIPIKPGGKSPLLRSWKEYQCRQPTRAEVIQWFADHPDANIAVLTGAGSGIVAVDIDGPEGEQWLQGLNANPPTLTNLTAKGRHAILAHPGVPIPSKAGIAPQVDVRGDGGYIVVPPSIHESGTPYRWDDENGMGLDLPPAPLPEQLLELIKDKAPAPTNEATGPGLPETIPEGTRNNTLTSYAGKLFRKGMGHDEVLEECLAVNRVRGAPPLPHDEVETIVNSIASRECVKRSWSRYQGREGSQGLERSIVTTSLAEVQAEPVDWLWPKYVPLGKLTILDGDPGVGKSSFTLDLAARVTRGRPMPDESPGIQGAVLLLTTEDGLADTVRPRLEAMGADVTAVHAVCELATDTGARLLRIPDDIPVLRAQIERHQARLVIIDPLIQYLSGSVNTWHDQHVRLALAPLAALADDTGAAVVLVRHLNKKQGLSALQRGGGSIGLIAQARLGLLIAPGPGDPGQRFLAATKSNVGPLPPALRFHFEQAGNGVARIVWDGPSDLSADQLLSGPDQPDSALQRAKDFLEDHLSDGPVPAIDVKAAAREAGISERTLRRASQAIPVRSHKVGRPGEAGHWEWSLSPTGPVPSEKGHLATFGGGASGAPEPGPRPPKAANSPLEPGGTFAEQDNVVDAPHGAPDSGLEQ
jgi:hypothetical protein